MLLLFSSFVVLLQYCDSARILGIVHTPSFSHQATFRPIWRELLQRGHHITLLTTHPMKDPDLPNLTEIDLSSTCSLYEEQVVLFINATEQLSYELLIKSFSLANELIDLQLGHPEVQNLISNKTEHFDLVMVEFICLSFTAFAHRFQSPYIGMISLAGLNQMYEIIGSPSHPVLYPDQFSGYSRNPTFFQRVLRVISHVLAKTFIEFFISYEQARIAKHFHEDYPPIHEILNNMDLLFVNTDPISGMVRPVGPNLIYIGGRKDYKRLQKPLPEDLQAVLDSARNGFIYFSLGSTVMGKNLPKKFRKMVLETLSELPYTVLWKFELEDLPDKPKNVYISKWFPQQDILRHPNIKLFITQGGLQSLEETVYNRVPFLGIPYFADQSMNMKKMEDRGLTISLDHSSLTKEEFKSAIIEIIENSRYRQKVIEMAELIQDEPMTGIERAVWWTEYVLRHKGAKHLRSPALDIPSYQYYLLDVIGFILLVTVVAVYLLVKVLTTVVRLLRWLLKSKRKVE